MLLVTLLLVFFTNLYLDFEFWVRVNWCMLPKVSPGCCVEVVCCFSSGEWVYLSLPTLLVYYGHLYLMFISYSVFKREKMPSSHELPQQYILGILKRPLLEKSTVEIASFIKKFISLYIKIRDKPVSVSRQKLESN